MSTETSRNHTWINVEVLGSGGFGQVTLWCNTYSGEKIAVKNLHEISLNDESRVKQVERWCNEVDIMRKLNHQNIIKALEVPSELKRLTSVPILVMEYCSLGNLRQVLCRAENCSGLEESQVLDILKDVSSGLAYLHSCKIVHRDIKPENIVLQQQNSNIIYKLIDLGYAKLLDQSSLLRSFVGTIQYIAPELFMGKEYSSSVDYWSFGLLTYEIITGHRPFLPGFSVSDWMKKIQGKPREVISVIENGKGDFIYTSKISSYNHLSSCLLSDFENWLQLALDWNGHTRGRDINTKQLFIFENLSFILSKKVIRVFFINAAKMFSYEITSETNIFDVRTWLRRDTNIDFEHQVLMVPSGTSLGDEGNLLNFLKNEKFPKKIILFLYKKGLVTLQNNQGGIHTLKSELTSLFGKILRYKKWKINFANLIYILHLEAVKCNLVLQGIKVKMNNTKENFSNIEALFEYVNEEWEQLKSFSKFLIFSQKIDLENYIYYRKTKKVKSNLVVQKWIQNVIEVNNKIVELKNLYNLGERKQFVLLAKKRFCSLKLNQTSTTPLDEIARKAHTLWEKIHSTSENEVVTSEDITSALNLISLCAQESENFFRNQILLSFLTKISEIDENLAQFEQHSKTELKSIAIVRSLIENTQKERQKQIWGLIEESKNLGPKDWDQNKDFTEVEKKERETSNNFMILKNNGCSLNNELLDESFTVERKISDVEFVIKCNHFLRHRIHEVQLDSQQIMKNINLFRLNIEADYEKSICN